MWLNCKPDLWTQNKWEVAKVYMPCGHENHSSVEDFDIAALLGLMKHCKHFKKFELGDLCVNVSNVRNNISHAPKYQLEQEEMHKYLEYIRDLVKKLARHDPQFTYVLEDIDQIENQLQISFVVTPTGDNEYMVSSTKHTHKMLSFRRVILW
ncbi:uncharacterized protein CXorf38 homolog [Centropristis striata]|uniref:uncharacterized protein CXorf38 homolog n=1 Tax=Centropristis striata TaxID=184440 RepID=UPI0027DEEB0C|nr:uncharacterized protein CXorf38 homolog [Centropristis striata]